MESCIIGYMLLTYAIKAAVFVWMFEWLKTKLTNNFVILILVFSIIFAALDFLLVAILPASNWKRNVRDRIRVPDNMYCTLSLDYLVKAMLLYYVYAPVKSEETGFYDSCAWPVKFVIVFGIMFCVDIVISLALEFGVNKEYSEQFCAMCSM